MLAYKFYVTVFLFVTLGLFLINVRLLYWSNIYNFTGMNFSQNSPKSPVTINFNHHQRPPAIDSGDVTNRFWTVRNDGVVHQEPDVPNPHQYGYLHKPLQSLCDDFSRNKISLLVLVTSEASKNGDRRRAIRETWARIPIQRIANFRVVFLLGKAAKKNEEQDGGEIKEEMEQYGDVLQEDFEDNLQNVALKSVMGLKWVAYHCKNVDYVMKTDDDIFVHVENVLFALKKLPKSGVLYCKANRRFSIKRGVEHPYYAVNFEQMPGNFYPDYCAGAAYVMSGDVANELYRASLRTHLFYVEDVYVTGFCREKAANNITITDEKDNFYLGLISIQASVCEFTLTRRMISNDQFGAQQLREVWEYLNMRNTENCQRKPIRGAGLNKPNLIIRGHKHQETFEIMNNISET